MLLLLLVGIYIFKFFHLAFREQASSRHTVTDFKMQINALYTDIVSICKREFAMIDMVFPFPERVTKPLLEFIFTDKVIPYIDLELNFSGRSIDDFIQILEFSFDKTSEVIDSLDDVIKSHSNATKQEVSIDQSKASASALVAALQSKEKTVGKHHVNLADLMNSIMSRYLDQYIVNENKILYNFVFEEISQVCVNHFNLHYLEYVFF